jgi:hypothetical protein
VAARNVLLEYILEASLRMIGSLTDLEVDNNIRRELSEALDPLLQTLCMLEYQKWQYTFEMLPAVVERHWIPLDPANMEGLFAEETGWIMASLFPQLCRIEQDNQVSRIMNTVAGSPLTSSRPYAVQSSAKPESRSSKISLA